MCEMSPDVKKGAECPIADCGDVVGDGHWVAEPSGFHTYHTDKRGIARHWEHVGGLDVTPTTEPYNTTTIDGVKEADR